MGQAAAEDLGAGERRAEERSREDRRRREAMVANGRGGDKRASEGGGSHVFLFPIFRAKKLGSEKQRGRQACPKWN